jgi:dTDP-4-dehydrorhamnose reductase
LGAGGRLGAALTREYREKFDVVGFNHSQLDLANVGEIHHNIDELEFDVLINAAAFTNVDLAESQRERAFAINTEAPKILSEICSEKKAKLIHFSTDYVFDGEKRKPYVETDVAKPISVYGESKRVGEKNVLAAVGEAGGFPGTATPSPTGKQMPLVVRVSWVFGPERPSFIDAMIKRAREEEKIDAVADKFSTPTYTRDIAEMLPQFFDVDVPGGVLHFANAGECSWQEYAQHALDRCQASGVSLKGKIVKPLKLTDMKSWVARRPVYSVLSAMKYTGLTGITPRSWRDAVSDYIERSYSKK